MDRVGIFDAKTHLSQLVDDVARHGRRIIIQRRGEDAAALVPCEEADAPRGEDSAEEVLAFFDELRAKQKPFGPGESIKDLIEEGRKW
jgi:prevent-host-death family protein